MRRVCVRAGLCKLRELKWRAIKSGASEREREKRPFVESDKNPFDGSMQLIFEFHPVSIFVIYVLYCRNLIWCFMSLFSARFFFIRFILFALQFRCVRVYLRWMNFTRTLTNLHENMAKRTPVCADCWNHRANGTVRPFGFCFYFIFIKFSSFFPSFSFLLQCA